ncbi:CIS tube protein [Marinobacter orientalis]|uniref:Contractile injection system tube protein N-terminal domain-containing protein n=1 Tax=Marinobacter orientalis TaxID=1928859 RepID=A0A7Y0REW7_9GAMM|nr:hypothetical protein [Marinobacter orientalis]NMT64994.1 hypothetical protein [Marinobacter orientalis]TGX48115.1 hypothetical protein DIT72_15965 [Marinobacter orientalis]
MKHPERGKLIPVSGKENTPDLDNAVNVQFNPTSLRVGLSNSLNTGDQRGSEKAAQYVSSSSSSLSIELIFDTTLPDDYADEQTSPDVRLLTRKIAERFLKPGGRVEEGSEERQVPSRCLFQWGAFEFVGLVEKFDETLDFFSPEGTPLRATVSLSLKEDSFQFRNRDAARAERDMPTLTGTGNSNQPGAEASTRPLPGASDRSKGNWRDTALYNGVENPRLPSGNEIASPAQSPARQLGLDQNPARSAVADAMKSAAPAFRYGNSSSLGSTIEGAFGYSLGGSPFDGLSAESLRQTRDQKVNELRERTDQPWLDTVRQAAQDSGVGFD